MALRRCPRLRDVDASIRILRHLGCNARVGGGCPGGGHRRPDRCDVPDALMREMRSSVIFLGAILARCGEADLSTPAAASWVPGPSTCTSPACGTWGGDRRYRRHPALPGGKADGAGDRAGLPSVGATENLMLAACGAEGVTVLSNAAREPEN